jgi:3-oxoacyl-[acyl-carrier-protein] synthase-1
MVQAFKSALADANKTMGDVDYRITDSNGEQYWFKEAALAVTRLLRARKEQFEIWHAADCIGEVGAAAGISALGICLAANRKDYAPGPAALCHLSGENKERVAMILSSVEGLN